jgi:hypothetical protein
MRGNHVLCLLVGCSIQSPRNANLSWANSRCQPPVHWHHIIFPNRSRWFKHHFIEYQAEVGIWNLYPRYLTFPLFIKSRDDSSSSMPNCILVKTYTQISLPANIAYYFHFTSGWAELTVYIVHGNVRIGGLRWYLHWYRNVTPLQPTLYHIVFW